MKLLFLRIHILHLQVVVNCGADPKETVQALMTRDRKT